MVALEGWFDAGGAATAAADWLSDRGDAEVIADIPAEEFFDFQQQRPIVSADGTGERTITWPDTTVAARVEPEGQHDLLVVRGVEPHLQWTSYVEEVLAAVVMTGTELVVTFGAVVAEVPHSRPVTVTGSAADERLCTHLGLRRPTYEGPTGVVGVLHAALERARVPAVSLRVPVPHYVSTPPNPAGTQALLRRFEQVTGVGTAFTELDDDVSEWRRQVDRAVASDDEVADYVRRLEELSPSPDDLPSGDDLAAEFERFLRGQDE